MVTLCNRADHYIFAVWFLSSFFLLFFFPRLISPPQIGCLPYVHTWCGLSVNLECRSEMCCARLAENAAGKKSPSGHHRTTLSGYVFAIKARINNWKQNLLSTNISPICPNNMVKFGPLAAEINPVVRGTPANFNGFRVLAALLHGTRVLGISHTLWRWTEGATYIWKCGHHVGHWPTF